MRPGVVTRVFPARAFVLLRVRGFELGIHATWPVMLVVLALLLPYDRAPSGFAGALARLGIALLFYVFVVLHELAHTALAFAWGLEPRRIVLFMFGGVSQIAREARSPRQEFHVAIAGPLASLLISGVLAAVALTLHPGRPVWGAGIWGTFAVLNLLLAVFNMLPGFPLDGGRVLRSVLWAASNDRARATRRAATGGKVLAGGLMAGGVVFVFLSFGTFDGGAWTGVWYVALGWLLYEIAGSAGRQEEARHEREPVAGRVTPTEPPATLRVPAPARPSRKGASSGRRPIVSGGPISTRKPAAARRANEGKAPKPDPRDGRSGRTNRARPARAASDQSRDRARHSRAGSAHARGGARRGRRA